MSVSINYEVAGGGSSSGGSGNSGTSITGGGITSVTEEVDPVNGGYRVQSFVRHGVEWTCAYNPDGSRASETAFAGVLVMTYTYTTDGAFPQEGGNYTDQKGRIVMDWATAADLGDDIAAGTWVVGTDLDNGLPIFVTDIAGGVELEWSDLIDWWRGPGGAPIVLEVFGNTSYHTGSTSESAAQITATVPGKLVAANGGQICAWANSQANVAATPTNATTGTVQSRWKLGSDTFSSGTTGTGVRKTTAAGVVINDGDRAVQTATLAAVPDGGGSSSSAGDFTNNTASDTTVTLTYQLSAGTDQVRVRRAKVWVQN